MHIYINLQMNPDLGRFLIVYYRKDRNKTLKEKRGGRKERRSRKPGEEKENSSKKPEETIVDVSSEGEEAVNVRGPTIPRNTGQRYSAILSPEKSSESRHHITFASQN